MVRSIFQRSRIAAQGTPALCGGAPETLAMRADQLDTAFGQMLAKATVGFPQDGDHLLFGETALLLRLPFWAAGERFFQPMIDREILGKSVPAFEPTPAGRRAGIF